MALFQRQQQQAHAFQGGDKVRTHWENYDDIRTATVLPLMPRVKRIGLDRHGNPEYDTFYWVRITIRFTGEGRKRRPVQVITERGERELERISY